MHEAPPRSTQAGYFCKTHSGSVFPRGSSTKGLPQAIPCTTKFAMDRCVCSLGTHTLSRTLGWHGTRHAPEILAVGNQSPSSREEAKAFNRLDLTCGINCYFLLSGWPFELHGTGKAAYEQFLGSLTPSSPCAVLVWPLPKTSRVRGGCHWQKLRKGGCSKSSTNDFWRDGE